MSKNVRATVETLLTLLRQADGALLESFYREQPESIDMARFYVEKAFVTLLVLTQHLEMPTIHNEVADMYKEAKSSKDGFAWSKVGPYDPYLVWEERLRMFVEAIAEVHGLNDEATVQPRELHAIIRRAVYQICDTSLFGTKPADESDVHDRLEAILRCTYPDLQRKPPLAKAIKSFAADTGIPSLKTLIEYKFVTNKSEAKLVVDQMLADVSGYHDSKWRNVLFVIYETSKVLPEEEWKALFAECGLAENHDLIVISGDMNTAPRPHRSQKRTRKRADNVSVPKRQNKRTK